VGKNGENCEGKRLGGGYRNGLPKTDQRSIYRKQVIFECSMLYHLEVGQMDHALVMLHFLLIRKGIQT